MARKYAVEGTRDFLYWAIGLLMLGAWAVRDGWFPPPSVQEKHPLRVPVAFEMGGVITEVFVRPNDPVRTGMVLAVLQRKVQEARLAELEQRLKELNGTGRSSASEGSAVETERKTADLARLAADLAEARRAVEMREIRAPTGGVARAVLARVNEVVRPGEPVVEIDPQDHFYLFNKSLALLCIAGALVCLIIHRKVR